MHLLGSSSGRLPLLSVRRALIGAKCRSRGVQESLQASQPKQTASFFSSIAYTSSINTAVDYNQLRQDHMPQIESLPEWRAQVALEQFLLEQAQHQDLSKLEAGSRATSDTTNMTQQELIVTVDAMLATFCLHVESRIAALMGLGFYTIGPCGEETLAAAAHALQPQDSMALHYRHLSIQIARQLIAAGAAERDPNFDILPQLLLDRARAYMVSRFDPVTGGVHCSIGSESSRDYVVTSTLASQCPPAVGRALATGLLNNMSSRQADDENGNDKAVSFVTLGDGSLHHGHFWSAFHLARHARQKRIKCPVLFGIADNGMSISYNTLGYSKTLFGDQNTDSLIPCFTVTNGNEMNEVFDQTLEAFDYVRRYSAPAIILYQQLQRRFGHAATDRQGAYLKLEDIAARAESDVLQRAFIDAVAYSRAADGDFTWSQLLHRFEQIQSWTQQAFTQAAQEPKVTRDDMIQRMTTVPAPFSTTSSSSSADDSAQQQQQQQQQQAVEDSMVSPYVEFKESPDAAVDEQQQQPGKAVMRKHMTRAFEELMEQDESIVYLGEDVRHGGYYLVTDGLATQFPTRLIDFPPDETSLMGAGLGMSQRGLTPIVEIPYAKYLDCASDMMAEIAMLPWLTNNTGGSGMVIRLQGFDRGLFGGNFHTHNMLSNVLLPGIDVVCYSNGHDYVRGLRHAIYLSQTYDRIVVSVDCTNLLNLRHLHDNDRGWETSYPELRSNNEDDDNDDNVSLKYFDTVQVYPGRDVNHENFSNLLPRVAIVSYGNGVVTSLQARVQISNAVVDVVDCPCLNRIPQGLIDALSAPSDDGYHAAVKPYDAIVFADICKEGPGSVFAPMAVDETMQQLVLSNTRWKVVSAPRCYNPLGSFETFLSVDDIVSAVADLV